MGRQIQLSDSFYTIDFQQLSQTEPHARTRLRLIGLAHIQAGKTFASIGESLLVNTQTVKNWMNSFRREGLKGLQEKSGRGVKQRLPESKEQQLFNSVLSLQKKCEGGRVGGKDVQLLLKNKFKVNYKLSAIYNLLHKIGLSWITSRSKHPKSDFEAQELFKKLQKYRYRCPSCGYSLREC